MSASFAVVDLFAGPGGLAEGFSRFNTASGRKPYDVCVSIEMDQAAHQTLALRSFFRSFESRPPAEYFEWLATGGAEPDWSNLYPAEWQAATHEAMCAELGSSRDQARILTRLRGVRDRHGDRTIVVGGPPCQAYSIAGRGRNKGNRDYVASEDHRHYLYDHYVAALRLLRPAAFVMENVKGILSSSPTGAGLFARILSDLENAAGPDSYSLFALNRSDDASLMYDPDGRFPAPAARDFVVDAEDHGVPQARHRVFIVGIRGDIVDEASFVRGPRLRRTVRQATVQDLLGDLHPLRSGLSRGDDTVSWRTVVTAARERLLGLNLDDCRSPMSPPCRERFNSCLEDLVFQGLERRRRQASAPGLSRPATLIEWIRDERIEVLPNHETRGHHPADLERYLFAAVFAKASGRSPKSRDFPAALAPNHRSWAAGTFADRFRVQIADRPSTTIVSHIAKDGHYYIHPDPAQCRSLTVREAARLQTFPDNYVFKGNRTQQYIQVGNAVPPFLARQIAEALWEVVGTRRTSAQRDMQPRAKVLA